MDPHTHFLFPFVTALVLVKFDIISWKLAVICGLVGILVDLDHYVEQIIYIKNNRFSLKSAWNNAVKYHRFNQRSFIHYRNGALILIIIFLIVSFFNWKIAAVLSIGYYSHLLLDYVHLRKEKFFRWKLKKLYLKESHLEIIIDLILVIALLMILFL